MKKKQFALLTRRNGQSDIFGFANTAYETFVTESRKIGALYGDLAKQSYKPFGGFVAKMTPTNR